MDYTTISASKFLSLWQRPVLRNNEYFDEETGAFFDIELDSHLEINGSYTETLRISDSKFKAVNIFKSNFTQNITFRDCVFEYDVIIEGADFGAILHFLNCEFKGNFIIREGNFDTLIFDNSNFHKQAKIDGGIFKKLIYASENEKSIFKINGRFTFIDTLKLVSVIGMTFFTKQCVVNKLIVQGYYNSSSRIDFYDIKCSSVEILNVNNDGKIYLSNFHYCSIKELKPVSLTAIVTNPHASDEEKSLHHEINTKLNLGTNIKLYNNFYFSSLRKELLYEKTKRDTFVYDIDVKTGSHFSIVSCSLGVLELRDIPLQNMGVKALSSDLSSIKLINTRFPLQIESFNVLNEYYIYNDLYTSANRQNNIRDKIEYYRISQQALLKNITSEGKFKSFPSYISIVVSKFASNHGSNWGQALLITLGVGIIFFTLFVISFQHIYIDLSKEGFEYFTNKILPFLPQFFNPLHKVEFMNDIGKQGGWTGLVDILGRLFISIGIFEMVRSFRKFVRN